MATVALLKKINDLEKTITELGYKISSQDARKFNDTLISFNTELLSLQRSCLNAFPNYTRLDDKFLYLSLESVACVQTSIIRLQKILKKIFEPTESKLSDQAKVGEHPTADFLDSLYKKRTFLIVQINQIESRSDVGGAESEILFDHLSQLYESFVKNQTKIENHVNGPALDEELKISGEILQKVMSLRTKLKKNFASVVSPSLIAESHKVVYLNSLIEKQKSLIQDIKSVDFSAGMFESKSTRLRNLKECFFSNQMKIEELVDGYDLEKQKDISRVTAVQIAINEKQLNFCSV